MKAFLWTANIRVFFSYCKGLVWLWEVGTSLQREECHPCLKAETDTKSLGWPIQSCHKRKYVYKQLGDKEFKRGIDRLLVW